MIPSCILGTQHKEDQIKERAESSHPESEHSLAVFLNLEPYNLEVLDTSLEQSYKELPQ